MKPLPKILLAILLLTVTSAGWTIDNQTTIEQWGVTHYQNHGKLEGRTLPASGNYGDYVRKYADLLEAYNVTVGDSRSTSGLLQLFLIPLYLGVCYFAFAPLFRDKANLIRLDSVFIATTVGVLVAGFLYIVPYRFGVPGEYLAVTALLFLAVFNCYRCKHAILPTVGSVTFPVWVTFGILFVLYGSFTLIAAMKMGAGDFPPVFFGQDTIQRLLQAHQLMNVVEFPPERLVTKGLPIPVYHMGASASVAALATITGLALHKVMYWIVSPLLVLGSFSALLLLIRSVLTTPSHRFIAMLIFIPELRWGDTINQVFFSQDRSFGWGNWFVENLFGGFTNSELFERHYIPLASQDITHFAGTFCLVLAAMLLVKRGHLAVFVLAPILVILAAFTRANVVFVVAGLIGIRLLISWRFFGLKRFSVIAIMLAAVILGGIVLLGYGSRLYAIREFPVGFDILIGHITRSLQYFSRASVSDYFIHTELFYVLTLSALFFLVAFREIGRDKQGVMLVLGSLIAVTAGLIAVSFLYIAMYLDRFWIPVWIAIPLGCLALLTKLNGAVWRKAVVILTISPIIAIGVVHQWRAIEDTIMVAFSPERTDRYNDNRLLAEAMRAIPVEGSVVVVDDIAYRPSGGTFVRLYLQRTNPLFSALFGHQMFSTWGNEPFSDTEKRREFIQHAMKLQEYHVGLNFNKTEPDFSIETMRVAKENGWTHFLLKLELDDPRARKSEDVPLEKLFENSKYAVYKF